MSDNIADHVPATGTRMSAAEFLDLPETTEPIELIHGEVLVSPTPTPQHQTIVTNLIVLLKPLARLIGGKVFSAPLDVYLDNQHVVQPDVMWIAPESRCSVGEKRLQGAPDLVVEVLSPATARHDRTSKFHLYQDYQSEEYWIVDPVHKLVEVWQLQEKTFVQQGIFGPSQTFDSPVLGGHTIDVTAIFENE